MNPPAADYEFEPDFAVVVSFLEKFGAHFGPEFERLTVEKLKDFLECKLRRDTDTCYSTSSY